MYISSRIKLRERIAEARRNWQRAQEIVNAWETFVADGYGPDGLLALENARHLLRTTGEVYRQALQDFSNEVLR